MCPFEDTTMIGLANQDVKDFIQVITIQKFFNFRSDLSLYKTIKNRSNVVLSVSLMLMVVNFAIYRCCHPCYFRTKYQITKFLKLKKNILSFNGKGDNIHKSEALKR